MLESVMAPLQTLTAEQADHFVEHGYVVVSDCLDPELVRRWTGRAYERLGYDSGDPTTWGKEIVWLDHETSLPVSEVSPHGWRALCDVVGGADRIDSAVYQIESQHFTTINSHEWSDAFIANFRLGADLPWAPATSATPGWHKDGSYFRHFLDSREQALLTILLWSDVEHRGGGTFFAADSVPVVASYLRDHPEGVTPDVFGALIDRCSDFREVTGPAGTLLILHPFTLHASSRNHAGRARLMSNPPIVLREPMNLNRSDAADFSLLERATLRALGEDRIEFRPTSGRQSDWQLVSSGARPGERAS
jgi:hypothetical protein